MGLGQQTIIIFITTFLLASCNNGEFNGGESLSNSNNKTNTSSVNAISKWPTSALGSNGINLKISDRILEFYSDDKTQLNEIYAQWNNSVSGQKLLVDTPQSIPNFEPSDLEDYGTDNTFGIYVSDSWFPDQDNFALAITQYFGIRNIDGDLELVHGDIILNNNSQFSYFTDLTLAAPDEYDLSSILLHEVGHFLGLGHQSFVAESVMQPTLSTFSVERTLYDLDRSSIQSIYEPSSSTTSLIASKVSSAKHEAPKNKIIRGVIKLMPDGLCQHYENDELVHQHFEEL
jgi:hypothetical protein